MIVPKVLKCHHVFCFTCIVKYFLEFKQNCPICQAIVCLKEMRSIQTVNLAYQPGDSLSCVLMKKNFKNFKVEFFETPELPSDNFLDKVHILSTGQFETMIFSEIEELLNNPNISELDPLIVDFCQFIDLKSIEKHHEYFAPLFLGKRPAVNTNKTLKEDFAYFYQEKEGLNIFMHPVDFSFLQKKFGDISNFPRKIDCRIESVQKFTQNSTYRKLLPQLSHVSMNSDLLIVRINLESFIPNLNMKEYRKGLEALQREIDFLSNSQQGWKKQQHQIWRKVSRNGESDEKREFDKDGRSLVQEEVVFMRPKNGKDGFDNLLQAEKQTSKKKPIYVWKPQVRSADKDAFEIFEIVNTMQDRDSKTELVDFMSQDRNEQIDQMFPELEKSGPGGSDQLSEQVARLQVHHSTFIESKAKAVVKDPQTEASILEENLNVITINKVKKKSKTKYSAKA
jgi:hypothetical protein